MLTIPSDILNDREIFPPNVPVTLRVSITFEQEDATFLEELSLQFLPSPIEMKVQTGFSSVFDVEERLVIDLTDSYTSDGLVVEGEGAGKWEWEWEWSCMAVQKGDDTREEGEECRYESGAVVVMPGEREGRFEAGEGERFQEGEAYYFSVKSRVREAGGGEVVAEGRWSTVMSGVREEGVGLELVEDYWVCEDSSVGFLVIIFWFFIVFFFFFFNFCLFLF